MLRGTILSLAGIIVFAWSVHGQEINTQNKAEYVSVPTELVLLVTASPPGCPIQIEKAQLLMNLQNRSFEFIYDVRNVGSKPLTQWQVMEWTSVGTGSTLSSKYLELNEHRILMPGDIIHVDATKTIPLTDSLRKALDMDKYKGTMIALMLNSAQFADGTTYKNTGFVTAVQTYFEELASKINRLENLTRKN